MEKEQSLAHTALTIFSDGLTFTLRSCYLILIDIVVEPVLIRDFLSLLSAHGIDSTCKRLLGRLLRYLANSRASEIYREVRTEQYNSGGTKRGKAEIQNALEWVLLCSCSSWKLMLEVHLSFRCLKGDEDIGGDKH